MSGKPRKCILLTDEEQKAREEDIEHFKRILFHTPGAGELSLRCAYDFSRGWEYALGRFKERELSRCVECPDLDLCNERNYKV